jgi:hypothetical protein
MGWHGVTEVVCAQECPCTDPHCRLGYGRGGGVARVFRAQSAAQVSVLSLEKICKNVETHAHCKTMFQKQGPADLQPFRHDEEYIRCRLRYRVRYHILYIVYDIVCIHYVVYNVQYTISFMMSYTISYAISFITTTEIYSAGLAAQASRLRFRVSAPLRLDS